MGYVMVKELQERSGEVNSHYQRTYTRTFLVETDNPSYGPYYAASHPSLPVLYTPYPEDPYAFCTTITPTSTESPTMWRITYKYAYTVDGMGVAAPTGVAAIDTQQQGVAPADRVENPLSRPRDYSFATQANRQTVVYKAYKNYSGTISGPFDVTNSAGDPINPPFELDLPIGVITVGLNALSAPGANWIAAFGQCNLNSVLLGPWLCAAGTLRNRGCSAQRVYENNLSYWRWTLTFEFRDTWDETILERGLRAYKNITDTYPTDIIDPITKRSTTVPLPLDASGLQLATGSPMVYTTWRYIPRVAFPSPL